MFRFYAYPVGKCRLRLSQLVTLPSYRRQGVGALLVRAVYRSAADSAQRGGLCTVDVSLEDPTDDTRRLRDAEDARRLLNDTECVAAADKAWEEAKRATAASPEDAQCYDPALWIPLRLPAKVSERMGSAFNIHKMQRRRAWEVLLLCRNAAADRRATPGDVPPALNALIRRRVYIETTGFEHVPDEPSASNPSARRDGRMSVALARKRILDDTSHNREAEANEGAASFVMWRASHAMLKAFADPKDVLIRALEGAKHAAGGHGNGGSRAMGSFLPTVPEPAVSEQNMQVEREKEKVDPEAFAELAAEALESACRAATMARR